MLEAYRTNAHMRAAFLRMNSITHAEIWDSEDNTGYQLVLCSSFRERVRESPVFGTPGQCVSWLRNTCNCQELAITG